MAFQKFKMKRDTNWVERKKAKSKSQWRKKQRDRKNSYR